MVGPILGAGAFHAMLNPSLGVSPATVVLGVRSVKVHFPLPAGKYIAGRVPITDNL